MRILFVLILLSTSVLAGNWNRFRGPEGRGHAGKMDVPKKWSSENIKWRVELEGIGQSCPVNWGDRLFLTSAKNRGLTRLVLCLDRKNGSLLWKREIGCDRPEKPHAMNTWATPTCVTDGERVIAFFGSAGLHCYDLDGKKLWSKEFGFFRGKWGVAASPIILGDQVLQNCDAEGTSFLVSLDKKSGREIWKSPREDKPRGGWSTPVLIHTESRDELLLNGEFGVRSYNPATGEEWWFCKGFNGRGSPIPEYAHGLIIVVNGKPGDVYSVKPGGKGDVTESHRVWHSPRIGGRDLPSPLVIGDYLFVSTMTGIASMYDAKSGKTLWTERLEGKFSASPLEANGLIYLLNEEGLTYVIKPGPELEIIEKNSIGDHPGEIFRAAISPISGQLFLRSTVALYCIGE